jgi:hypothetical protein
MGLLHHPDETTAHARIDSVSLVQLHTLMSAERDQMIATLKEYVLPVLKARGYKGSFPHFRRPTDFAIHLLNFQFDKWGGGFVVEIASCPVEGPHSCIKKGEACLVHP